MYVWDSTDASSSATVVWPGSNRDDAAYGEIMKDSSIAALGQMGGNYCQISAMDPGESRSRLMAGWIEGARRVPVPAGALLLWSSRTMHQGWAGGARLAQPLCWEPASRCASRGVGVVKRRKMRLSALALPSTHWASLGEAHSMAVEDNVVMPTDAADAEAPEDVRLPLRGHLRAVGLAPDVHDSREEELREKFRWKFHPDTDDDDELAAALVDETSKMCCECKLVWLSHQRQECIAWYPFGCAT